MALSLEIDTGDPLAVEADGLIHPTTGEEAPRGERLPDFYARAGEEVLESVKAGQPVRIGETIETGGGELPFKTIVHTPVQTGPGAPTTEESLQAALRSGLVMIDKPSVRSVVLPRLIPEVMADEVDYEEAARVVIHDLLQYPPQHLRTAHLVDPDAGWSEALRRARGEKQ